MELDVFIRGLVQPLGPPLRPLGPVVRHRRRRRRGDQLRPARGLLRHGARRRPDPPRPEPRQPEVLRRSRSSAAGTCPRTGGGTCSPTTSAATASAGSSSATTAPGSPSREQPELIKTPHVGLPADRRQDGPRRRDLHRRLVQPDHPARRGRLPRPPPRPHPRPDLAGHRQGPPARRAAEARRRRRPRRCSTP